MSDEKVPYWRDLSFKALEKFSKELRMDPDLILLAEYIESKEKALRKQAYKKLDEFIIMALNFKETKRRNLAQRICQMKIQWGSP